MRLQRELFLKAYRMDVACYDDPEFYNDFVWAMDEANKRSDEVIDDIGKLVTRIVSMSTLITVMLTIDVPVAIAILAASVLCVLINQTGNLWSFEQEKYWKPLYRVRNYINRVFQLQDHAKEIRTSRVTNLLMRDYDENTEKSVKLAKKYGMKWFLLYGIGWMSVSAGLQFGVLFYMFGKLESGLVLVGAFAASVSVIWSIRWQVTDFVEKAAKFPKHSLFLEKYYGFLAYEPKIKTGEAEVPEFSSLELRDVTFTYDFSDKPKYEWHNADWEKPEGEQSSAEALKNVSLSLSRGEKIAIVGYNGAGKTTLIKLLMRLYDPTSGQILMNGRDIREYDLDAYREKIGVVFQDFKIYAASIAENVMNGDYDPEHDRETVIAALDKAGFSEKLATLEQGVDTTLTREFDKKGTNLSGGEGQKVAIARVFAAITSLSSWMSRRRRSIPSPNTNSTARSLNMPPTKRSFSSRTGFRPREWLTVYICSTAGALSNPALTTSLWRRTANMPPCSGSRRRNTPKALHKKSAAAHLRCGRPFLLFLFNFVVIKL